MRSIIIFILAITGCGAGQRAVEMTSPGEPLRLTRVVMYQNGLAHFERRGRAETSAIDLRVPSEQVNDVLRSLTIVDGTDAAITGVRMLPSDEGDDVTLRIGLSSEGARDLRISYVTELPGFRPTYRLIVRDDEQVHLQGLAVVDNPTSEGWQDVALTLSTEVPLSFRFDVREARLPNRPRFGSDGRLLDRPTPSAPIAALLPRGSNEINEAYGMAQLGQPRGSTRSGRRVSPGQSDMGAAASPLPSPASPTGGNPLERGSGSDALLVFEERPEGEEGVFAEMEGFDLGRGESGLVPFVDTATEGQAVLLFKPSPGGPLSAMHPYRAVLFHNPTSAALLTGPVSIFNGERFIGDGVTGTVAGGAHAFVPYALERSVEVNHEREEVEDEVHAIALAGGVLTVELRAVNRQRFTVSSTRDLETALYVYAPGIDGFEPRDLPEGTIRTGHGYFLRATPGEAVTFDLFQRRTTRVNIASDPDHSYVPALLRLLDGGEDGSRLREIADRSTAIAEELDTHSEDRRVESAALYERRAALEALDGVGGSGDLRRRIARGVAESVARVDAITRRASALHAEEISLEREWYARLRSITTRSE